MITEIPAIDIDDLIADIAMVFHWPPVSFDTMSVSELLKWHRLAATRIGQNDE
ncbi:GpE family phage tail protein [Morganella morganii]|uniref:GpE family phage tail protein n=1 Tax=Morganella morganii TaxID=582 RepID=UPI0031E7FCAA